MSPHTFEITLTGELDQALRDEFEDMRITVERGVTRLRGIGADPSMLHGVLHRIDSLGLELLAVRQLDEPLEP